MIYSAKFNPERDIRIVQLHSRSSSQKKSPPCPQSSVPIHCDLLVVLRAESSHYNALSYTWGDSKDTIPIFVGGEEFQATRNLHLALEHIRDDNIDVRLWIDALCINQNDIKEKKIQVDLMQIIYAQAAITTVWLGPCADDSDRVMAEFQRVGSYIVKNRVLDSMIEFGALSSDNAERCQELDAKVTEDLSKYFKEARDDLSGTLSLLEATRELMSRDYWTRVWIQQEFAVSPNLCIQCGTMTLQFEQFYGGTFYIPRMKEHVVTTLGAQLREIALRLPREEMDEHLIQTFFSLVRLKVTSTAARSFGMRRRYNSPEAEKQNLMQILARVHVSSSNDPVKSTEDKDRVFGLLGLAVDRESLSEVLDYSKSCHDIYTGVARAMILSGQVDLLSLSQRFKSNDDLPSWVPDWRETIVRPSGQMPWDTSFCASGENRPHSPALEDDVSSGQIALHGYRVDIIEEVGDPWTPIGTSRIVTGNSGVPSDQAMATYLAEIVHFCGASDIKLQRSGFEIYSNTKDRGEAHIRVPVADQEVYGIGFTRKADQQCHLGYQLVLDQTEESQPKESEAVIAKEGYENAVGWQQFRAPFLSVKGYVGLVPDYAEVGDLIVILSGAKFPYVLRQGMEGSFKFIGEAYVHGIMYGEFVERKENELEECVFVLGR